MSSIHEIRLAGCTPEPLMGYLKALGVLRVVAEQKDECAKGCWRGGEFVLKSSLDEQGLLDFLTNEYKPTAVIVPWSGGDFFGVSIGGNSGPFRDTPTSSVIIEAFIASTSKRLSDYRAAIRCALEVLHFSGITSKEKMKDKAKSRFLSTLRSRCGEGVVRWIDTCAVMTSEKPTFSALLGSGGGSDGNTHFSDNFMQNLWEVLPDFDDQRKTPRPVSQESLKNALYGLPFSGLIPKRTSSLYDGGAVGGPNAGHGFERVSFGNPWSIIICIEGTMLLAGAITRRHGELLGGGSSFPFQTRLTPTSSDSASHSETFGREIWLPLWGAFATKNEIEALFSEGRASVGRKASIRGVDFARAAASLGVDRGIASFHRFGIIKGRVGGDNYNTSTSFGRFDVGKKPGVDLLKQADGWLERFRGAVAGDNVPPRFGAALRRIESAIFAFCKFGGATRFGEILRAFGNAEHELAKGEKFREDRHLQPLSGLSPEWLRAADDKSTEFELARALAGIRDREGKVEAIRSNLEPVSFANWKKSGLCDVWNSPNVSINLLSTLERRMMDAERLGCQGLPLASRHKASIGAIANYIEGSVDDGKIEELLWGMVTMDHWKPLMEEPPTQMVEDGEGGKEGSAVIPRAYALLRLLFLPSPLSHGDIEVTVQPESAVTALLRAGRTGEACAIAARRIRASSLTPMTYRRGAKPLNEIADWRADGVDSVRLGAALLFPISVWSIDELKEMVVRPDNKRLPH